MAFYVPKEAACTGVMGGGGGPAEDGVYEVTCTEITLAGDEFPGKFDPEAHFFHLDAEDGTTIRQVESAPYDENGDPFPGQDEGQLKRRTNRMNAMAQSFGALDQEQGYTDEFIVGKVGYIEWAAGDRGLNVFGRIMKYITADEYDEAKKNDRTVDFSRWRAAQAKRADEKTGGGDGRRAGRPERPSRPGGATRPPRPGVEAKTEAKVETKVDNGATSSARPKPPRPAGTASWVGT